MRLIRDIHAEKKLAGKPAISFEFFPPKTPEGDKALLERTIPSLMELKPDYCSVTYGAGGSTRDKTLSIAEDIQNRHQLTTMSHLTCVNATREQIGEVVDDLKRRGIQNILALRGDPPAGQQEFTRTEGGFEYSHELVAYLKERGGFSIGTAGFPEGHIACHEGREVDWGHLANKIQRGADFVVTQLFFDNADYYRFATHLKEMLGIQVPLIPGILPILNTAQITRFTELCGASIPTPIRQTLDELGDDEAAVTEFGIQNAIRQCRELLDAGAPGIHFYTLNKAAATTQILAGLGLV